MNIVKTLVALLATLSFAAHATVITFDDQVVEAKPNGYTVSGVTFIDTNGEDLFITDTGKGNLALAVLIDDDSFLAMLFPSESNSLSLMFGNDREAATKPGDRAELTLFLGGTEVGRTWVALNRNGALDQTIALNGINFDVAFFGYTDSGGSPIDLTELVDNISFTAADSVPVPEPASLGLLGLGLLGVAVSRRRWTPRVRK